MSTVRVLTASQWGICLFLTQRTVEGNISKTAILNFAVGNIIIL